MIGVITFLLVTNVSMPAFGLWSEGFERAWGANVRVEYSRNEQANVERAVSFLVGVLQHGEPQGWGCGT